MPERFSFPASWARRAMLSGLAAGALLMTAAASAQAYPSKPIKIIVPFAPGGLTDNVIRVFAAKLGERLHQSVVVDNRPGANGNIGTAAAAQSPADGYTLLAGFDGALVINPHIYSKMPFDTVKDFTPITNLGLGGLVLAANPSVPANDVRDLIALLKAKPNSLSFASAGIGSTSHLAAEMLKSRTGIQMEHIAYKGGGSAVSDVVGGHVPLIYTSVSTVQQYIKLGKMKGLGVSSLRRAAALPDVPTFIESGVPDFVVASWIGLLAPANTPRAIIEKLQAESLLALQTKEVQDQYALFGIETIGNTPEQFGAQIRDDLARWGAIVKQAKVRME